MKSMQAIRLAAMSLSVLAVSVCSTWVIVGSQLLA